MGVVDAGVYKGIDKEGRIQYPDAPRAQFKATAVHIRIRTIKAPPVVSRIERRATLAPTQAAGVRIYTTTGCG